MTLESAANGTFENETRNKKLNFGTLLHKYILLKPTLIISLKYPAIVFSLDNCVVPTSED